LLGVLLASDWEKVEDLLIRYFEFLRKRYQEQPKNRTINSSEVQTELKLDDEQTKLLGRLIVLGNLYSKFGWLFIKLESKDCRLAFSEG